MDEFPGLLARDFGFRPQGKSAPMSASKSATASDGVGTAPGSGRSSAAAPSWNRSRSGWNDGDSLPRGGISGDRSPPGYDDVFGGPPRYSNPSSHGHSVSSSPPSYDSIFDGFKDSAPIPSAPKHPSLPVFDKPVYDDDIFDGVPGMKNPSSGKYDDIFATMSSASNHNSTPPYDDLLDNLGKTMPEPKGSAGRRSGELKEQDLSAFDELLPGFGGSSPPQKRESRETKQPPAASSARPTAEDPFVVLETSSTSAYPSTGLFTDPLEHITRPMNSGSPMNDASQFSGGLFDDDDFTKSVPLFTSKMNENPEDKSTLKTEKEPHQRSSMETFENIMPQQSSDSLKTAGRSGVQNSDTSASSYEGNAMADQSPKSYEHLETADDVWLTVDEIHLFTQPTSAPPPSRPPPPVAIKQAPFGRVDQFSSLGLNSKRKDNDPLSQYSQHMKNSMKKSGISSIDELEDFALGNSQRYANEHAEVPTSEEEFETNSAAAAMKEAMDRAEAKFKHAREVRERERDARSARNREPMQQERYEKVIPDAQDPEEEEVKQEILDREREQRDREEKEEQKRREKEKVQELERERARQAVERATREARERAAAEARLKAERAAVEKANAEARQRAERAAVQRAANEARERAAAEARERAAAEIRDRERAAAEARERERAAAEARERERAAAESRERERERATVRERAATEKAAVERAANEARLRAQRAAVERAGAEARERAAAEAQRKAAASAAARDRQQKTDNDLESFFNMGARPSSAPKQRNPTSESPFDAQFSKGFSDGAYRTSPGPSSTIRKTQSTTNVVDDLASIFGAPSSSGEFQEVEGESDERRRARLERHQRTLERAAKALAEKNNRDMQAQREQAERHRIAETLDIEVKRWAAGKEGNLRALLSTLQYVLWPECGWQPVSLTDLITGASVKKVYRKATLCIHPDKVQQKGATLQQKYIAEKVFDILKEAWNKFNSEELF